MTFLTVRRVALAALLIGGCDASEPAPPDRLTACETLTVEEVEAVLGGPVTTPAESSEAATDTLAGRSGCAWSRRDGNRAVLVELVRTNDMASSVRRTGFSASARFSAVTAEHPDAEAPAGIGDRALYVEEEATLHVLTGRSYLTFEVAATPPSAIRTAAVGLATRAVARIERADRAD